MSNQILPGDHYLILFCYNCFSKYSEFPHKWNSDYLCANPRCRADAGMIELMGHTHIHPRENKFSNQKQEA